MATSIKLSGKILDTFYRHYISAIVSCMLRGSYSDGDEAMSDIVQEFKRVAFKDRENLSDEEQLLIDFVWYTLPKVSELAVSPYCEDLSKIQSDLKIVEDKIFQQFKTICLCRNDEDTHNCA